MNLKLLFSVLVAGCLAAPGTGTAASLEKKVLLVGIDGTMVQSLALANTPNLNALKANGCFSDQALTHPVEEALGGLFARFDGNTEAEGHPPEPLLALHAQQEQASGERQIRVLEVL